MPYRKKRFGDRKEGRRLRSLPPMNRVSSYIMKTRSGASNSFSDMVEISEVERYIRKKRQEGLKGFGILHVFIAMYVRVVSQRPGINRFIGGQEVHARNDIVVSLTMKKEMKLDAMETVVKVSFTPYSTANDVYESLNAVVTENRASGDQSDFDRTARLLNYIPRLVLRFLVWVLTVMDYFDWLPAILLALSPFHASFFITSMGSLGIPPVFHHLYEFGNMPVFCSYGPKHTEYITQHDGSILRRTFVDFTIVSDERICDGHYFASSLKLMKEYFRHPERLDMPPETIVEDID